MKIFFLILNLLGSIIFFCMGLYAFWWSKTPNHVDACFYLLMSLSFDLARKMDKPDDEL
jgi:hypothetical protein